MLREERVKKINDAAEKMYQILDLKPGFNIFEVVRKIGGRTEAIASDIVNYDAEIEGFGDTFVIRYCDSKPDTRIRFSIAHEIGHLFLHMIKRTDNNKPDEITIIPNKYERGGYSINEEEANEFAAALLMPKSEFIKVAEECFTFEDGYNVVEVANRFGVSTKAAEHRGYKLNIWI